MGSSSKAVRLGPATQALDRATKRRRTENAAVKVKENKFDFEALFTAASPSDEVFPSITWDFDEKESTPKGCTVDPVSILPLADKRRSAGSKRSLVGMLRSKTFKNSLCDLVSRDDCIAERPTLTSASTRIGLSVDGPGP